MRSPGAGTHQHLEIPRIGGTVFLVNVATGEEERLLVEVREPAAVSMVLELGKPLAGDQHFLVGGVPRRSSGHLAANCRREGRRQSVVV